jgi:hypothetical protein
MKMKTVRKQQEKTPPPKVRTRVADGYRQLPVMADPPPPEPANKGFALHCDHVTVTIENITPKIAAEMLNVNRVNRRLRDSHAEALAADMSAGRWTYCTAPIVIYESGNIADGQHRLWAIVESGKSQKFVVHRGLRQPEGLNIDTGAGRSVVDAAHISGLDPHLSTNLVSVARSIEEGVPMMGKSTNAQKLGLVAKHRAAASFAISHVRGRGLCNGAVLGAIGRAWYRVDDKAKLQRFCDVLRTGFSEGTHESAAVAIRNYLLAAKHSGTSSLWRDTFLKVQNAIRIFMSGRPLTWVKKVSEEAYPLK